MSPEPEFHRGVTENWHLMRYQQLLRDFQSGREVGEICRRRILHVMQNDKFNAPYIDLIQTQFDPQDHVFLFYSGYSEEEFKIPRNENVWVLYDPVDFPILQTLFNAARQVIFHSLFYQEVVCYLHESRVDLSKAYWVVWGGDMYQDRDLLQDSYFQIKRDFVRQLGGLIHVARQDNLVARELYGVTRPHFHALYRNPLLKEDLDQFAANKTKEGRTVIQINHSCDQSTVEILEQLRRFAHERITVRVVLSYGALQFRDNIIQMGTDIFGSNFVAITDYVSPTRYSELISDTDVLIMNQPRQQGLGNIYAFLYLGTKVYVRRDVTTWDFLREEGFEIFDTLDLPKTFGDLVALDPMSRSYNRVEAGRYFDDKYLTELWEKIFAVGVNR